MRTRLYEIVSRPKKGDNVSCLYDLLIVVVALFSIAPALFHSNSIHQQTKDVLATIDIVTVYILSFDYLLHWMTFDIAQGRRGRWREFLKYPFTFEALVNLASILPTLNILPSGFLFLRALRIVRLFSYSRNLVVIVNVFIHERRTLGSVFTLALAYIFATALVMFTFEPDTFDNFMDAVYWATITLTTIGFGDITPSSDLGHVLTTITSIFGIFIFALPVGIMTGGFLKQLRDKEEEGDDYYSTTLFGGIKLSGLCFTPAKIKAYFKDNPKVRLYICFFALGIALNFFLCLIFSELWQPIWLDTTGTALVACALDPAAAVIVSFVNNLIIAVYQDSPQNILYVSESALVALVYGYMFAQAKDGSLPRQNVLKILVVIVVVQSTISVVLAFCLNGGNFTTIFQNGYRDFFIEQGVDKYAASFFSLFIDRTIDALGVMAIVTLILRRMKKHGFVARAWLDAHCIEKPKPAKKTNAHAGAEASVPKTATGFLSCAEEAVCLNRDSLRQLASCMREEAANNKDVKVASACASSAETIRLLCRSNIKNADEFKRIFLESVLEDN